jgi:hypothetical protein
MNKSNTNSVGGGEGFRAVVTSEEFPNTGNLSEHVSIENSMMQHTISFELQETFVRPIYSLFLRRDSVYG